MGAIAQRAFFTTPPPTSFINQKKGTKSQTKVYGSYEEEES